MPTFHGKQELKDQLLSNLHAHQAADEFIQGTYWSDGKGCAVGCSIVDFGGRTDDHAEYERLFGIPRVLAQMEDGIFEGLSVDDSKWWPVAFIKAIPVGVEMDLVFYRFMEWLLIDPVDGVIKYAGDDGKKAITAVGEAMGLVADGADRGLIDWKALRAAADAAYAAYAAAHAAHAADAARQEAHKKQALKLIEIMSAL